MEIEYYAVAHHGTAGLGNSYGYAEVVQDEDAPRHDQTTTVWGPYNTKEGAENAVARMEALCAAFRERND